VLRAISHICRISAHRRRAAARDRHWRKAAMGSGFAAFIAADRSRLTCGTIFAFLK
jgi:hypothetical protein